ncbi:MAG: hypothetical protein ACKO38_06040, partial [Planctomycetota bacterium]
MRSRVPMSFRSLGIRVDDVAYEGKAVPSAPHSKDGGVLVLECGALRRRFSVAEELSCPGNHAFQGRSARWALASLTWRPRGKRC